MPTTNPYHFVPVGRDPVVPGLPAADLGKPESGVTHDRYTPGSFTGRILCELTLEEDTVIGAAQTGAAPTTVHPFEIDGKPAVPATTLRGMFSAIAEAASNSALRVLDNTFYTVRDTMRDFLPTIGMIVIQPDGSRRLRPLVMPMHSEKWGTQGRAVVRPEFRPMFANPYRNRLAKTAPPPKVYLNEYVSGEAGKFLATPGLRSYSADHREYWYIRLSGAYRPPNAGYEFEISRPHAKNTNNGRLLIGQLAEDDPIPERCVDHRTKRLYTRGLLRLLDIPERPKNQPSDRHHELFIPYPEEMETYPTFPITPGAWTEFHAVADDVTEHTRADDPPLPYHLVGSLRSEPAGRKIKLRDGDLVYFKPTADGNQVERIGLSAIWRQSKRHAHDYFAKVSAELIPFDATKRKFVSITEQLFGFVETVTEAEKARRESLPAADQPAKALAGRVRFSAAKIAPGQAEPFCLEATKDPPGRVLRILASPKPPCPVMYFHPNDSPQGGYVAKADLKPGAHTPNGRKFYVHRQNVGNPGKPWFTGPNEPEKALKQKVRVTPLRKGLKFLFHVDFENLSRPELELLCYALRPSEAFRHKIGMGKALGLGSIRIDPVGIFFINPAKRYSLEVLKSDTPRYHGADAAAVTEERWKEVCPREVAALGIGPNGFPSWATLRDRWKQRLVGDHAPIATALEVIGDPAAVQTQVRTPAVHGGLLEGETFKWFVTNENGANHNPAPHHFLPLITKTGNLPDLPQLPPPGNH